MISYLKFPRDVMRLRCNQVCNPLNKDTRKEHMQNALFSMRRVWRHKSNSNTTIDSIDTYESNQVLW